MSTMKKNALLLATFLAVSTLGGCAGSAPSSTASNGSSNAETTAAAKSDSKTDTAAASGEPAEIVIYTYALGQATTPSNAEDVERVANYIAEKINVKPKLVMAPSGNEVEKLNLLLASAEQIDIFKGDWTNYAAKNVIIPVNDYLTEYGKEVSAAWPKESWDAMTDKDGKIWGVAGSNPTTPYPLYIREDWLKACGLEQPKNFDDLENVLKAFKEKDFSGNGTTIPMITSLRGLRYNLSAGYTGVGYGQWLDPSDNQIKPIELMPEYKEFIIRMADWYKKGYIFKESFAGNVVRDMLKQNKVGVHAEWYSNVTFSEPILQQNVPEAHYAMIPLAGPKSDISESIAKGGQFGSLITSRCKDPVAAMKYINFGYEDMENFIIMKDGIEGINFKWKDKELKITEAFDPNKITYYGEMAYIPLGMPIEGKLNTDLPEQKIHYDYLRKYAMEYGRTMKPADFSTFYNTNEIKQKLPNVTDINTMIDEQTVAFVTGTRPIADWDKFMKELNDAGLQDWIKVYTEEYNRLNAK